MRSGCVAAVAVALAGCGKSSHESATTTTGATTATTVPATTMGSTPTGASGTTTVGSTNPSTTTKGGYDHAMQARIDLVAAQCYSTDPGVAAREQVRRYQQALAQLEAIQPPAAAARGHAELIDVDREYVKVIRKRIPTADRLSAALKRARADGRISSGEQTRLAQLQRKLTLGFLPPRALGKREGDALRELSREGFDVEPKGPPKREYVRRVQKLVDEAGNPATAFKATPDGARLQVQLRQQRDVAWRAARALDDITPPDAVANAQQALVGGMCERGRYYDDLAQSLEFRHDPQTVKGTLVNARDVNRIITLYPGAFVEYRRSGYALRPAR